MLKQLSGFNRTRRVALSPKVLETRAEYARLAGDALFRAYPSMQDFTAEICLLDAGGMLELFWSIHNLGGEAPGGWHQVLDLKLVFERTSDGATQTVELSSHIAGFHAWYRMRGGMIPVLPTSRYLNLPAGEWTVYLDGTLQDVRALCLFADAFDDMFHYPIIQKFHAKTRAELLAIKHITDEDPAPLLPFHIAAGTLTLAEDFTTPIIDKQANRLQQTAVRYADVAALPAPAITVPEATPLDPVNYFREKMYYLQEQSKRLNYCPYDTVNYWDREPDLQRTQFSVNERTAYFHIEALAPLYRATGDPEVYRTARKWYETIARNIWPAPGGGAMLSCDRTVFGSALGNGGMCDAVCTFAEIDGNPRWVAPIREGLRDWPMHPTIARPLMDQDAWGNEEMNTTGTYNMCTHFALACWRSGHFLNDDALKAKGEYILNNYTFPGEQHGVWMYRPGGNFPTHHYDMYTKWQLSRLLLTGAPRWTEDQAFLACLRRSMDYSLAHYTEQRDGALYYWDWTHNPSVTHPANAARHGTQQAEMLMVMAMYVDAGYLEPLTLLVRGLYRLLMLPEVDRCWHGSWFHVHGNLLALALHGFHVEGNRPEEIQLVRTEQAAVASQR